MVEQFNLIILPVIWVIAIDFAAFVLGWHVLKRTIDQSVTSKFFAIAFSVAMGRIIFAFGLFALGALHWLYEIILLLIIVVICIYGIHQIIKKQISLKPYQNETFDFYFYFAAAYFLLHLFLLFKLQHRHDALVYHLTIPQVYLKNHGITEFPYFLFFNMPHNLDLLYTLPHAFGKIIGLKLFSWNYNWIILAALMHGAKRLGVANLTGVLILLYLSNYMVHFHLPSSYIEPGLACYLLLGYLLLFEAKRTGKNDALVVVGLIAGFLLAAKYTVWFFLITLMMGLFSIVLVRWMKSKMRLTVVALIFFACMISPALWFTKNYLMTGNPIFPMAHHLFDSKGWTTNIDLLLNRVYGIDDRKLHSGLLWSTIEFFQHSWKLFYKEVFEHKPFSTLLVFIFFAVPFFPATYRRPYIYIVFAAFVSLLAWRLSPSTQVRFLTAILPLCVLAVVPVLLTLSKNKWTWGITQIVVLIGFFIHAEIPKPNWRVFTASYYKELENNDYFKYVWTMLPERTHHEIKTILCMFENRSYYTPYNVIIDSGYEIPFAIEMLWKEQTPEAAARQLEKMDVTHILYNKHLAQDYYFGNHDLFGDPYYFTQKKLDEQKLFLDIFLGRECRITYDGGGVAFYELYPRKTVSLVELNASEAIRFKGRGLEIYVNQPIISQAFQLEIDWDDHYELQVYQGDDLVSVYQLLPQSQSPLEAPRIANTPTLHQITFDQPIEWSKLVLLPINGNGHYQLTRLNVFHE